MESPSGSSQFGAARLFYRMPCIRINFGFRIDEIYNSLIQTLARFIPLRRRAKKHGRFLCDSDCRTYGVKIRRLSKHD